MQFRDDIQGLRALAIVLVVIYHAMPIWAPGGFLGVDVFFVISGFLISTILLRDIRDGRFSLARFYGNRVRRIFPALFAMLACVTPVACLILSPYELRQFGQTLAATALFLSNMAFERLSGYFNLGAALMPLLHTWSLAVEEQFYLFFPVFLAIVWRWRKGAVFSAFLVAGCASLVLYFWLADVRSLNSSFFLGPARAYELMIGAALSVDPFPSIHRAARELLAAAGAAAILASALVPGLGRLDFGPPLACLGTAAIIRAGRDGRSAISTMLSLPAIMFIGDISYSLYLWHWPILSLAKNWLLRELAGAETIAAIGAAIVMAILSRRFIEKPALGMPLSRTGARMAAAASACAVLLGATLALGQGFPQRFAPEARRLFAFRNETSAAGNRCHADQKHEIPFSRLCAFGSPQAANTVAIWSDSLGIELPSAMAQVMPARRFLQISYSFCPAALNFDPQAPTGCAAHNREVLAAVLRDARIRTVILLARYSYSAGFSASFWPGFGQAVASLAAAGKHVVLVYPFPDLPAPAPDASGLLQARGRSPLEFGVSLEQFRSENKATILQLDRLARRYSLASVFPERLFCSQSFCSVYDGHNVLYRDGHHLTPTGARKLAVAIEPML